MSLGDSIVNLFLKNVFFTNIENNYLLKIKKKLLSNMHGLRIKEIYVEDFLTKNVQNAQHSKLKINHFTT